MKIKVIQHLLVITLLIIIALMNILSAKNKTTTYDEPKHFRFGLRLWQLNPIKHCSGTMPFSLLNVIPGKIVATFNARKLSELHGQIKVGRLLTVVFSLLLAFIVFKWSKHLYGIVPAFFSLIIYSFSPNIIAFSRLITLDLYAACMITISSYFFWRFIKWGGWERATLSAVILGLAQLAKYTCLFLYPIFLLIVIVRYSKDIAQLIKNRRYHFLAARLKSFLQFGLFFLLIGILIINAGFLFQKSFMPLGKYEFQSDPFKSIQANFTAFKRFPCPLPYAYVKDLDRFLYLQKEGKSFGKIYLWGTLKKGTGFKGYYLFAFLYKVPISIQLFILFTILAYILNRKKYNFRENEIFLIAPILFYAVYFNFFFKMNIGIRHFIVVFPLLHIFCGSLLKNWQTFNIKKKGLIIVLIFYLIISVLSYFPHYLSYFNEIVWNRKLAYKILSDSNIDWGQNKWYLEKYLARHPNCHLNPKVPVAGRIVVEVNRLTGLWGPNKYRWLRENFEPSDHIAYSYLVYDISPKELEDMNEYSHRK